MIVTLYPSRKYEYSVFIILPIFKVTILCNELNLKDETVHKPVFFL